MADLMTGGVPVASNGNGIASPRRPTAAPAPTGSPSGMRTPRTIMQDRAERERQRAEADRLERERIEQERIRAQQEARLIEETRQRNADQRSAGVPPAHGSGGTTNTNNKPNEPGRQAHEALQTSRAPNASHMQQQATAHRRSQSQDYPSATHQRQQSNASRPGEPPVQVAETTRPRNSFPHAFERWETLSAHWEGLTSYWIRKLEQNSNEISRDPVSQQLGRQVTDLSAAGANLFHAVVELQRLRASSERKFQRWFFETRSELERAQEVNARLEAALEKERRDRTDAIRDAVDRERGASKAQLQLAEMRRELAISKEEARRAWEELGRREQEERDRTFSLQSGQPTIVGGVQVVPMTQGAPSRQGGSSREQSGYQPEYGQGYPPQSQASAPQASTAAAGGSYYRPQEPSQQQAGGHGGGGSEGGYSDEEFETPATANPPSAGYETPSTTAPPSQWTGTYSNPQDYSGQGYGAPGWETVPRHHHPTRLSDVIEEEDERSRTSASQVSRG